MGYHVAIVKTIGSADSVLERSEVSSVVADAPELEFDGEVLSLRGAPFLEFSDGELWLKNPDESDLAGMIELAAKLDGRVRGDELETYSSISESYSHPDDQYLLESAKSEYILIRAQTRRRQWIVNAAIFGFFSLLAVLAAWLD